MQKLSEKIKQILGFNRAHLVILLVYAIIFTSISIVNHYLLRTSSDPTAIYSNCLYDYRDLRPNQCTLLTPINAKLDTPFFDNKLSDHFNAILFVVAPFSYIFGSYTLLIFQLIAIILGGIGIRKYLIRKNDNWFANLAMIHFFSIWGIYSALGFDYHDNVIAAMLLPWLLYKIEMKKWLTGFFILIVMLLCKESVSIWLFSIFCALLIFHWKERSIRNFSLIGAVITLLYFIVVTKFVMPYLANPGREYLHFHYSALGASYSEAIKFVLTNPLTTIKFFFVNHINDPYGDNIKTELFYTMFISGGFALILRPKYLIMAFPIIAIKVLNDDIGKWGLNGHYSIEFVPILTLALFHWLSHKKHQKNMTLLATLFVALTFTITLIKNNTRTSKWFSKERTNFLVKSHYTRDFDLKEAYRMLGHIPKDENIKVSAHYNLLPHLAFRDKIYEFPVVHDADYIILLKSGSGYYPISEKEFNLELKKYLSSACWETVEEIESIIVLKRTKETKQDYEEYPWHKPRKK